MIDPEDSFPDGVIEQFVMCAGGVRTYKKSGVRTALSLTMQCKFRAVGCVCVVEKTLNKSLCSHKLMCNAAITFE